MKKLLAIKSLSVLLLTVLILNLCSCGYETNPLKVSKNVADRITKDDANYKITTDTQEFIVDGNKMYEKIVNGEKVFESYMVKESDNTVYTYKFFEGVWYKRPSAILEKTTFGKYLLSQTILCAFDYVEGDYENEDYSCDNLENLGNGRYAFSIDPQIPEADIQNYIFTVADGTITEIELNGRVYKLTYGGQTVTLPSAVVSQKLTTPQNLSITNGILTWDEVYGAEIYYVAFYFGVLPNGLRNFSGYQLVDCSELNLYECFANDSRYESGTYQIIVTAKNSQGLSFSYESKESEPIDYDYVKAND